MWIDDKSIVEPCLFERGILSVIKRIAFPKADDTFGVVVRSTGSMATDEVALNFNREKWDWFKNLYAIVGEEYEQPRRIEDALVILTKSGMKIAAISLRNLVHREVWKGDVRKNNPELRTRWPKGLQFQVPFIHGGFELNPSNLLQKLLFSEAHLFMAADNMNLHPVDWAIVTCPLLVGLLSEYLDQNGFIELNDHIYQVVEDDGVGFTIIEDTPDLLVPVYFIPVSTNDEDKGTFYYYADARRTIDDIPGKDRFWTDDGLYVWEMEQCKWDYQLMVWHTYKPVITVPELAVVIPDVRISPPEGVV